MATDIARHLVRGVAWSVSMRWAMRGIGFVNVVILARLLVPEDFGVVAMATIVIGFIAGFTELGSDQLLIRAEDPDRAHIDTAWTIHILQALFIAVVMVAVAPLASGYFGEPRIVPILHILAISTVISGFNNIGITLARKELNFSLDFKAQVLQRMALFIVTLIFVLALRNYWALVYGRLVGSIIGVFISYGLHPYRPRLCFKRITEYLTFSYAIVPLKVARFLNEKLDTIIVGGHVGTATVGIYNIASDLSKLFTTEIAIPLGRGLYPGYAKLTGDPRELAITFRKVLATSAGIILPVGIGVGVVAEQLITVLLGAKWLGAAPYLQWLAAYSVILSIVRLMSTQILIVSGHENRAAILSWARVVALLVASLYAVQHYGPLGVAMACPVVGLIMFPPAVWVLSTSLPISKQEILATLWRPVLATVVMVIVIWYIDTKVDLKSFSELILSVSVGGLTYMSVMLASWYYTGKPEGLEYALESVLRQALKSLNSNSSRA